MQSLQKPATTLMMKNGIQHNRKTPMIIPMVIAAFIYVLEKKSESRYYAFTKTISRKKVLKLTLCSWISGESLNVTIVDFFVLSFFSLVFVLPPFISTLSLIMTSVWPAWLNSSCFCCASCKTCNRYNGLECALKQKGA